VLDVSTARTYLVSHLLTPWNSDLVYTGLSFRAAHFRLCILGRPARHVDIISLPHASYCRNRGGLKLFYAWLGVKQRFRSKLY
jgi:hypothetical protein